LVLVREQALVPGLGLVWRLEPALALALAPEPQPGIR